MGKEHPDTSIARRICGGIVSDMIGKINGKGFDVKKTMNP
jgi:hypothetical protein